MTITHDPHGASPSPGKLTDLFQLGLDAPICLTWELTYACNLSCVHCLSSSGRRDPRELTTRECMDVIDTLERMQVFYVNIGGGEPTVRPDFWDLVDYATAHHVGVKFSTNGVKITPEAAARHRGGERRGARGRLLRHRDARDGESRRRRVPRVQAVGGHDQAEHPAA
jgi:uncharacterized radical SAM superfamily Fe-S cluster-containing enzyme